MWTYDVGVNAPLTGHLIVISFKLGENQNGNQNHNEKPLGRDC